MTPRAVVLVLLLAACGGGGDDEPTTTTTTSVGRPGECTRADLDELMAGVEGGAWSDGYAYVPDGEDAVVERLRARCGDSVRIARGAPIRPVGGTP